MTQIVNRTSVHAKVTLINMMQFVLFLMFGTAILHATSTGVAPVLVPYQINVVAGNSQSSTGGYSGEGVVATNAVLNAPDAVAVDSVGNAYIADSASAIIREISAQTGIIQTIAGVPPTNCNGTLCTTVTPGCSDGVQAFGNPVGGKIEGLAVDGYGNVYFADYNYQGLWVIYKGGAQVANFIALVDSATVASASAVQPGYVYHIAGTAVMKKGGGCTDSQGTPSAAAALATSVGVHDPINIGLDGAGNIYLQDYGNSVVWVINTQATAQTIFGVTLQPGFMYAAVNCNKNTTPCPTSTAFGVQAGAALFNTLAAMYVDQFGNVYEVDTKGAPNIYEGVAYAGGAQLAKLLNLEMGANPVAGDWYQVVNNINSTVAPTTAPADVLVNSINDLVLRPSSITVDPWGNLYLLDYHWEIVYRIDANSQVASRLNSKTPVVGTLAAPVYCNGTSGPASIDAYGDGCPVSQSIMNSAGTGYISFDSSGNLYFIDESNNILRKVSVNTQFPATAVGTPVSQTIQIHFDQSNLPSTTGSTAPFTLGTGISDFQITGTPTCKNNTGALDSSQDCFVVITFTPTAAGTRQIALQATTQNGSVFNYALSGVGQASQFAVDGGAQSAVATGLSNPAAVAVSPNGAVYIANAGTGQVVVSVNGAQSTVGTGLSNPQGVALDGVGNVYISDTGNNRVVEVSAASGAQTVLTTNVNAPQGLAVDAIGNVYIADTGNARIVEISPFGELGVAPMLAYDANEFTTPVAVAVDESGNIYVADSGNKTGIIKITAGGGDLQVPSGSSAVPSPVTVLPFNGQSIATPAGIAVDAAGNLYVTDAGNQKSTPTVSPAIYAIPSGSGSASVPFALTLPGLGSPAGIALDATGNIYVADSSNNQVVEIARYQASYNFGSLPDYQTESASFTVTNTGNEAAAVDIPFATMSGNTADFAESDTCNSAGLGTPYLFPGTHCEISSTYQPIALGTLTETLSLQNGLASLKLNGIGQTDAVAIAMAVSPAPSTLTQGSTATVTATITQPHGSNTPTGTVTFNFTMNGVSQSSVTQSLASSAQGIATASLSITNLLEGRTYVVTATYNGDSMDSQTMGSPFTFAVPGLQLTAVAPSVSYTYGGTVPTLSGTLTGILPADAAAITVTWVSAATPSSPVGSFPIQVKLSGGNYQNYTIPTTLTPTGAPAMVTENPAPLSVVVPNATTVYGNTQTAVTFDKIVTSTGWVNGDSAIVVSCTIGGQAVLNSGDFNVGTYTMVPMVGDIVNGYDHVKNYTVTATDGTLTVIQSTPSVTTSDPVSSVLPTNLAAAPLKITVSQASSWNGTPTGTVTFTDTFTPLTATGYGAPVVETPVALPLSNGSATYTLSSTTIGLHSYTATYSGDSNFVAAATASGVATNLLVDQPDFSIAATGSAIQVMPGVTPGGLSTGNEQVAYPEQATITIAPILGSTETVTLTCSSPATYVICSMSPSSLTLNGKASQTSVISIQTPATLPLDYSLSRLMTGDSRTVLAFLPLGTLVLLPLCLGKRRKALRIFWMMLALVAVSAVMSSCGATHVQFFTPVPEGPQTVTVTATSGSNSRPVVLNIIIE